MTVEPLQPEIPFVRQLYGIEVIDDAFTPQPRKWVVAIEKYRIRRQWALTMIHPDTPGLHEVVAYFRSQEQAEKFAAFMRVLVRDKS